MALRKYGYNPQVKAVKYADGTERWQCGRTTLRRIAEENNAVIRIAGTRAVWLDAEILDAVFSAKGGEINE